MKKKTFLLRAVACLLCLLTVPNVAWGVTIEVPTEGTLEKVIDDSDEPSFPTLKIVGRLNAADIAYLRTGVSRLASIQVLDLSDVTLVSGDEVYSTVKWQPDDGLMSNATATFYIADENRVESGRGTNSLGGNNYTYKYYSNNLAGAFAQMNYKQVVLPKGQKEIGEYAFYKCENLTSVVLDGDVECIGEYAFFGCISLQDMDLSHVTEMGSAAFAACPLFRGNEEGTVNLSSLSIIPQSAFGTEDVSKISIGGNVENTAIKHIVFSNQLIEISFRAFNFCNAIENIGLPEGLLSIGDYTFYSCSSLSSVTIPSTVTNIGGYAFSNCSLLSSVTIPPTVTGVSASVFENTPFIKNLPAENDVVYLNTTALYYKGKSQDFDLLLREGTTEIGAGFLSATNSYYSIYLKSVTLPSTLKRIGSGAFASANKLTSIVLPEGLEEIGRNAFNGCTGIESLNLPSTLRVIGDCAFQKMDKLTTIVLPDALESIGSYAFDGCKISGEVTIPANVKQLGKSIFGFKNDIWRIRYNAINAENVTSDYIFGNGAERLIVGANVRLLPDYMFASENSNLKKVTFEERTDDAELIIGTRCFAGTSITEIELPKGKIEIGGGAFYHCSQLASFSTLGVVTKINEYYDHGYYGAFEHTKLTEFIVPDGLTYVGDNAFNYPHFYNSSGEIDESVLTTVHLGNSVKHIGDNAFTDCNALTDIQFGDQVESIGARAFNGCTSLSSFTIPDGVTAIEDATFGRCPFTEITIPASVKSIGRWAFQSCTQLTAVHVTDGLEEIGEEAFSNCDLHEFTLPSTIKALGKWCLGGGNSNMKDIYSLIQKPFGMPEYEHPFYSTYYTLHVPSGSLQQYRETYPWSSFKTIVEIEEGPVEEPVTEGVIVNATNFPDANFCSWIKSQSYGQDGILTKEEIAEVTNINVGFRSVKSLQGIEYFTALKELFCSGCPLTSIDISKNTALEKLYCYSNQLTAIDVSQNTALTTLHCGINQLTSLDVSQNTALKELHCDENQLTSLDLSKNVKLTQLYCRLNQIKGAEMDALIASLPTGNFYTFAVMNSENEGNVVTTTQVAAAKAKGWRPIYWNGTTWKEYVGSEPILTEKCATPTISITEGKLHFLCETEGVTYVSHVEMPASFDSDSEDVILPKVKVSVYAQKEGYENSDIAMKEIVIGSANGIRGDVNGDGEVSLPDAMFIVNRILNGKFPDEE